uniref:ADP-ribosylation factor-like protein 6-interacting protein 4 n=1 Tax=Micrurus carvalhoi TaxID=3147026 RepID=A0A2H6N0E0_9SAUR
MLVSDLCQNYLTLFDALFFPSLFFFLMVSSTYPWEISSFFLALMSWKKKKKKKAKKERGKEEGTKKEEAPGPSLDQWQKEAGPDSGPALTDEQKFRIQAMKPMTKEEWDARQSVIRKVLDPETGRMRLIKGDGEILEEIVTKDRHKEINKQANRGDGLSFQMKMGMLQ